MKQPLTIERADIELLCRALEFASRHMAKNSDEDNRIPDLRQKLETGLPYAPTYALAVAVQARQIDADEAHALTIFESEAKERGDEDPFSIRLNFDGICNVCCKQRSMSQARAQQMLNILTRDGLLAIAEGRGLRRMTAKGMDALTAWRADLPKQPAPLTPPDVYELTNDQARVLEILAHSQNPLTNLRTAEALEARAAEGMARTLAGDFIIDLHRDGLLCIDGLSGNRTAYGLTPKGLAAFDAWKGRQQGEAKLTGDKQSQPGSFAHEVEQALTYFATGNPSKGMDCIGGLLLQINERLCAVEAKTDRP